MRIQQTCRNESGNLGEYLSRVSDPVNFVIVGDLPKPPYKLSGVCRKTDGMTTRGSAASRRNSPGSIRILRPPASPADAPDTACNRDFAAFSTVRASDRGDSMGTFGFSESCRPAAIMVVSV